MPSLAKLQHQFQAYIHDSEQQDIRHAIVNDTLVGADKRLSIYYNAYRYRLIETLATHYPKLCQYLGQYLGEALFQQYALAYIEQNPSTCKNLRNYGANFDQYLNATAPNNPELAEIAEFEWLLGLAFDAPNQIQMTLDKFANIPADRWGKLQFEFHPAISCIDTRWNSVEIWQAIRHNQIPPKPKKRFQILTWIIWRSKTEDDLDANYRSLSPAESLAFNAAYNDHADFATLCEVLAVSQASDDSQNNDVPMQAAKYLAQWINDGYLTNIHDA